MLLDASHLLLIAPRDLVAPGGIVSGRHLIELFDQCRAAGLTSLAAETDIDRLHAM